MKKVSIKQAFWLPRFARLELSDRQGAESVLTARMLSVKDRTEPRGLIGE